MASNDKKRGNRRGKSGPDGLGVGSGAADDRKAKRAEAVAAMKREQARRETRSRLLMASGVVVAVLIVVAVGVYVGLNRSTNDSASAAPRADASAAVVADLAGIPASTYDAVGTGDAIATPTSTGEDPDLVDGKASFLYVGAEYCPYCAAERWAMAAALSRFGTFSGLKETESSATDAYPSTRTLSFYGAKYTSDYVDFTAVETQTNTGKPLETLSGDALKTEQKYNSPPYVSSDGAGAIPFVDISNAYISSGATYDAQVIQGMSHAQIAAALKDPDSDVAKAVDGAANLFTAAICDADGGQPSTVCDSSGVQAGEKALAASKGAQSGNPSSD